MTDSAKSGTKLHDKHTEFFFQILKLSIEFFNSEFTKTWSKVIEFLNTFITELVKSPNLEEDILNFMN